MNKLARAFDRATQKMDRLYGVDGQYTSRELSGVDLTTGQQTITERACAVKVRAFPLSQRDLIELSQAGIDQVETRWSMRAAYVADVKPQDVLSVSGFNYEVLGTPGAILDEFGVEWTIYTRRIRT